VLWVLMPSGWMEGLFFTIWFMNHSKLSSLGSRSWEMDDGWEDGIEIWSIDFPTSTSLQGGTQIGTIKGGIGENGIIGSSHDIWSISQFLKAGRM